MIFPMKFDQLGIDQPVRETLSSSMPYRADNLRIGRQSLYSILVLVKQPGQSVHRGLAANPRRGLEPPSNTTNCDFRKISPKMENPMAASD